MCCLFFLVDKIESDGLHDINLILDKTAGGWPVIRGPYWKEDQFNWLNTTYKLFLHGFDINSFISFKVEANFDNSSYNIIQIDQPTFGISLEVLKRPIDDPILQDYYRYMVNVSVGFGAERIRAEKEMMEVVLLESKLANVSYKPFINIDSFWLPCICFF